VMRTTLDLQRPLSLRHYIMVTACSAQDIKGGLTHKKKKSARAPYPAIHPSSYSHSRTMQFLALASLLLACGPLAASAMGILFPLYFYPSTSGSDCSAWQPLIDAYAGPLPTVFLIIDVALGSGTIQTCRS
jgi:hypothetical protein